MANRFPFLPRGTSIVGVSLLVASTLLAGCGDPGTITVGQRSTETPATVPGAVETPGAAGATLASLRQSGENSAAVESARFEMTMAIGDTPFMTVEGEMGNGTSRQSTKMSMPAVLDGEGLDEELPEADIPFLSGDMTMETIVTADASYVRGSLVGMMAGFFGSDGSTTDQWYRIELPSDADGSVAEEFGTFEAGPGTAQLLAGAYGDITTVGTEDVRGEGTTHYRVDIDPSKLTDDSLDDLIGDAAFPLDVWIDAEGIVRRTVMEVEWPDMAGEPGSATVTFEMFDVGADITVEVPADAETLDMENLLDLDDMFGN